MDTPSTPSTGPAEASKPDVRTKAREFADEARSSAETFAEERKAEGAERLEGVAGTARRVAEEVAQESPAVAEFVRKAASSLDGVSQDLKSMSVGDLVGSINGFARREPAAFLAASAVAGFALSRLLKSSAQPTSQSGGAGAAVTTPSAGASTSIRTGESDLPLSPGDSGPARARSGADTVPPDPAILKPGGVSSVVAKPVADAPSVSGASAAPIQPIK